MNQRNLIKIKKPKMLIIIQRKLFNHKLLKKKIVLKMLFLNQNLHFKLKPKDR